MTIKESYSKGKKGQIFTKKKKRKKKTFFFWENGFTKKEKNWISEEEKLNFLRKNLFFLKKKWNFLIEGKMEKWKTLFSWKLIHFLRKKLIISNTKKVSWKRI